MDAQILRRTTEDAGVLIAEVVGDVDVSNAYELGEALIASADNTTLGVVLDLSRTVYLDSAGVHVLLKVHRRLRARRQQLRLVAADDAFVSEVLHFTGVPSVAPLHASVEDAVSAIRRTVAPGRSDEEDEQPEPRR